MSRLLGLVGLGLRRVGGRLTGPAPGRTVVSIVGVALAVGALVVVTGVALGLAGSATVQSEDVNYWIVPQQDDRGISPLAYEGANLGAVHETSAQIRADDRVDHASPVAVQPVRLTNPATGDEEWVLALGIIPSEEGYDLAGVETGALDASYPYYDGGTYNGTWTGELLVGPAVADRLSADRGDQLGTNGTDRSLEIVGVTADDPNVGPGEAPVVVMHLAELQSITGTAADDQADQIMVLTDAQLREDLADVYPGTAVESRSGLFGLSATPSSLPFAMALASGLVAFGIGVAFVATMMGLELTATRGSLAILDAVGVGRRSVAVVLVTETVSIALLGGVLGIVLGAIGILGVNAGIAGLVNLPPVATFDTVLIAYGLLAAVAVGVLSVLYPLYIAWRTDTLAELTR